MVHQIKRYRTLVDGQEFVNGTNRSPLIQLGSKFEAMLADDYANTVGLSLIVTPRRSLKGLDKQLDAVEGRTVTLGDTSTLAVHNQPKI